MAKRKSKSSKTPVKKATVPSKTFQEQYVKSQIALGEHFGKQITSIWNSQKNPGKVYIFGRRIHHGEIGFIGAILSALALSPTAMGFFKALMEDDIHDKDQWFKFEKEPKLAMG